MLCGGRHEPGLASAVVLQWVDLTPCGYCCSSVTAVLCVQVVLYPLVSHLQIQPIADSTIVG